MGFAGIKKFFISSILFITLLFACDRVLGWWLEKTFYMQTHGDDLVSIHIAEQSREDVLILGGSRASHHYITDKIAQQTGMSCYNGGRDNMDVIYASAILDLVYQRYVPKVLILDVTPLELADTRERSMAIQRVSTALLPFSHKYPQLFSTVALANGLEPLKAQLSHIYPYNSLVGSIVQNTYTHLGHQTIKGYEPLAGHLDSANYTESVWGKYIDNYPLNRICVGRLSAIIDAAKKHHVRLITVVSPFYFPFEFSRNRSYLALKHTVEAAGYEFYDFSHATPFLKNPYLFKDDIHLNDSGANIYSKMIADLISSATQKDNI